MFGKQKCETLKQIRKTIADLNGIDYTPKRCNHKGDCAGTCPKCDQEAQYLFEKLLEREMNGHPILIDSFSVNKMETLVYDYPQLLGDVEVPEEIDKKRNTKEWKRNH